MKILQKIFFIYILTLLIVIFMPIVNAQTPEEVDSSLPKITNPLNAPNLAVTIPGFLKFNQATCTDSECINPWLADYINGIFRYGTGVIVILAVIVMMIAGVIWITAGGKEERVADAKQWIAGSLMGLLIALSSYIILNVINPALTVLSPIKIAYITKIDVPEELEPEALTSQFTSGPQGISGFSNGQHKVPIIYQNSFSSLHMGIGACGCGPTSLTMVLNFYGVNQTVTQTATTAKNDKNWLGKTGNSDTDKPCGGWRGGMDGFKKYLTAAGLKTKTGSSFEDAIKLLEYGPVIMSIKNTGGCAFTKQGHYVVLTGYNNGTLIINDPNKRNVGSTDNITLPNAKKGCIINAGVITAYK